MVFGKRIFTGNSLIIITAILLIWFLLVTRNQYLQDRQETILCPEPESESTVIYNQYPHDMSIWAEFDPSVIESSFHHLSQLSYQFDPSIKLLLFYTINVLFCHKIIISLFIVTIVITHLHRRRWLPSQINLVSKNCSSSDNTEIHIFRREKGRIPFLFGKFISR